MNHGDPKNPEKNPHPPRGPFTGGQNVPNTGYDFEMTHLDEKTWKGYFYRDMLQNEDYFGLGVCHWDVTQAAPVFAVHGENFVPGSGLENVKSLTRYSKRANLWIARKLTPC